jgi:hypothetical protein
MKRFLPVALALAAGCSTYTQAEIALVRQARNGVDLIAKQDGQRAAAFREAAKLRREKLDAAFDADVQLRSTRETLDPDWVVEARKAYALAIDAYATARVADDQANESRRRNLAAIHAALARLEWMQSVRHRFDLFNDDSQRQAQERP